MRLVWHLSHLSSGADSHDGLCDKYQRFKLDTLRESRGFLLAQLYASCGVISSVVRSAATAVSSIRRVRDGDQRGTCGTHPANRKQNRPRDVSGCLGEIWGDSSHFSASRRFSAFPVSG